MIEAVLVLSGGWSSWAHPGASKEEPVTCFLRSVQGHMARGSPKVWAVPARGFGASMLLGRGLGLPWAAQCGGRAGPNCGALSLPHLPPALLCCVLSPVS